MMTRTHRINDMAVGDLCPEKAGVGGSIPSLATILLSPIVTASAIVPFARSAVVLSAA
jgi:hypothetical protein